MDTDVVKAFNAELTSVYDQKPPLSKKKIQDISKAALKAKSFYKHVVFSVEKFLAKCKVEYKIPVLYVIDSIIRASKHQFKEKDVYASRFLKNFSKTLTDLLQCPEQDRCRVVRTINLWESNGVYTADQLIAFKEQCQSMGIETDVEAVERAVKGSKADMSIYGGHYVSKRPKQPKFEAKTPPLPNTAAKVEPERVVEESPREEPSSVVPEGAISERQLLELMKRTGNDFGNAFSTDISLLKKAHGIFCEHLLQRQKDLIAEQKGNIKNLLSSQFDYSDEEDSGDEARERKQEPPEPKQMTHEQVYKLAEDLLKYPSVGEALKTLHTERLAMLNQVAVFNQQRALQNAQAQNQAAAMANLQLQHGINVSMPPPALGGLVGAIPSSAAGPTSLAGLPPGFQLPPGVALSNMANLALLGQVNPQQLQGMQPLVQGANGQNFMNMINPMNLLGQPPPNVNFTSPNKTAQQNIEELMAQQQIKLSNSLGAGLMGANPLANMNNLESRDSRDSRDNRDHRDGRRDDYRDDENDRSRRKRSRSRDRDRDDSKRNRSGRDRKDRDRDRERRKLGLPSLQEGFAIVASKTLWFGRLPSNCSENDIKNAVRSIGEVSRISIIASKACGYITMDSRRNASDVVHKLGRDMKINSKSIKVGWGLGNGVKMEPYSKWWDSEKGVTQIPWDNLPLEMESLCDGGYLDLESLPPHKKGLFTESGKLTIPLAEADPTGMELSSPQNSPPMTTTSIETSPIKLPPPQPQQQEVFYGNIGLPPSLPPSMPSHLQGLPQMPPAAPSMTHMQFPIRAPPPVGRPPLLGQPNMNLPGAMGLPGHSSQPSFPPQPPQQQQQQNFFGSPGRGGGPPQPFRGGRGAPRGYMSPRGRGGFRGGGSFDGSDRFGGRGGGDWQNDRNGPPNGRFPYRNGDDSRDRPRFDDRRAMERERPSWDTSDRRDDRDRDRRDADRHDGGERRRRDRDGPRRSRWNNEDERSEPRRSRSRERSRDRSRDRSRERRRERASPPGPPGDNEPENNGSAPPPQQESRDDDIVTSTTADIVVPPVSVDEDKSKFEEEMRREKQSEDDLLESAISAEDTSATPIEE